MAKFKVFYQVEAQQEIEVEVEATSWLEAQRIVEDLGKSEEWRSEQLKKVLPQQEVAAQQCVGAKGGSPFLTRGFPEEEMLPLLYNSRELS